MRKIVYPALFGILFLVLWQIIISLMKIPSYLLPKPSEIISILWMKKSELIFHAGVTTFEALSGYFLAILIGLFAGFLFAKNEKYKLAFYPYSIILQTLPAIVIAPLLIIWLGNGIIIKVLLAMILALFPIITNTFRGLSSTPVQFVDLFKILGATEKHLWIKIKFKFALPYIFQGLRVSLGLSFIGALVGEFVGANKGLGSMILISSYHLDTSLIFASIFLLIMVLLCLLFFLERIEERLLFWYEGIGKKYM